MRGNDAGSRRRLQAACKAGRYNRAVHELLCAALSIASVLPGAAVPAPDDLLLATTTSVRDSGLLDALVPLFREKTGVRVRTVAVGSGAALRMGAQGNADALLTHAPEEEEALVASGAALSRTPFMENYFVIAGPREDPAGVREAPSAVEAVRRIADAEAPWVSRDDDSGTHRRERALFVAADPVGGPADGADWPGFARTGSGMGLSLQVAGERSAYILSDLGTWLAYRERTGLAALYDRPDPVLRNVYSLLRVDPARFPRVAAEAANRLESFLLSPEVQRRIAGFGSERFGRPLFRPLAMSGVGAPSSDFSGAP